MNSQGTDICASRMQQRYPYFIPELDAATLLQPLHLELISSNAFVTARIALPAAPIVWVPKGHTISVAKLESTGALLLKKLDR